MFNIIKKSKEVVRVNDTIFSYICGKIKKEIIIDSSKDIKRAIMLYRNIGYQCKIIHLVRDVRGVAYSAKKTRYSVALPPDYIKKEYPAKEIRTVEQTVNVWNRQNRLIRSLLKLFVHRNDYMTVRYEDLIQKPKMTLGKVCEWLQIDFAEDMIHFGNKCHHNIGGNPSRFNSSSIKNLPEKWKTALSADEKDYCSRYAARLLRKFNYE